MTGAEIVPTAMAVAKKVADGDGGAKLADIAKDTPEMQIAAREYAKRIAIRQTLYTKLYAPIARMLGMSNEYFDQQFAEDMARKTEHLSEEDIVEPKPYIAAQAMQGLGYSLDEADLKEMYLNLLTTASTASRQRQAHPSFAEIIKQLSSDEARVLKLAFSRPIWGMCQLTRKTIGQEGHVVMATHLLPWKTVAGEPARSTVTAPWVDNWVRLGLVETSYINTLTAEGSYDWCEELPELAELRASGRDDVTFNVQHGHMATTTFGRQFFAAVSDERPIVVPDPPQPSDAAPDEAP